MALKPCRDCGEPVSSSASACPKCGKPVSSAGAAVAGVVVLAMLAFGAWWFFARTPPGAPAMPPSGPAVPTMDPPPPPRPRPQPTAESKAKQGKRKRFLEDLVGAQVFHGYVRAPGRNVIVFRIGPRWRGLPLEEKQLAADVAFTYHWVENPELTSALLEDWRNGKTVASFTPEFGLRIEE
jgi:hypothetical protein